MYYICSKTTINNSILCSKYCNCQYDVYCGYGHILCLRCRFNLRRNPHGGHQDHESRAHEHRTHKPSRMGRYDYIGPLKRGSTTTNTCSNQSLRFTWSAILHLVPNTSGWCCSTGEWQSCRSVVRTAMGQQWYSCSSGLCAMGWRV